MEDKLLERTGCRKSLRKIEEDGGKGKIAPEEGFETLTHLKAKKKEKEKKSLRMASGKSMIQEILIVLKVDG